MTYSEKLQKWLNDPNTPPNAWMELTFPQIDKLAGVRSHNACNQLPKIIARRTGKTEKEVREMRNVYRRRNGLPYVVIEDN